MNLEQAKVQVKPGQRFIYNRIEYEVIEVKGEEAIIKPAGSGFPTSYNIDVLRSLPGVIWVMEDWWRTVMNLENDKTRVKPGQHFKVNGNEFVIVYVADDNVIIRDIDKGSMHSYGVDTLTRQIGLTWVDEDDALE